MITARVLILHVSFGEDGVSLRRRGKPNVVRHFIVSAKRVAEVGPSAKVSCVGDEFLIEYLPDSATYGEAT